MILPQKEQFLRRQRIITTRLETLLPILMAEERVDLWIVTGGGFLPSYLFDSLVYERPLFSTVLLMLRRGKTVEYYCNLPRGHSLCQRYAGIALSNEDRMAAVARFIEEKQPERIALNHSEVFDMLDTMSYTSRKRLENAIGSISSERIVSAEALAMRYLQIRTGAELEDYRAVCALSRDIILKTFTRRKITPGQTTTEDIEWLLRQEIADRGLEYTWGPDVDLQRHGSGEIKLGYKVQDFTVEKGDLLHVDFGIRYLGLESDMQYLAYVLGENEDRAPAGLERAFARALDAQDVFMASIRPGMSGNEAWCAILDKTRAQGLDAMIYSHVIGPCTHGTGPCIGGFRVVENIHPYGDYIIEENCCMAMELNVYESIPEWNGQKIYIFTEDDVMVGREGAALLGPRQEELIII